MSASLGAPAPCSLSNGTNAELVVRTRDVLNCNDWRWNRHVGRLLDEALLLSLHRSQGMVDAPLGTWNHHFLVLAGNVVTGKENALAASLLQCARDR